MIGKPKYKYGDIVTFEILDNDDKKYRVTGYIYIVDAYGTFEQNEEPSYDIMVERSHLDNTPCLYKHIRESYIVEE